jgi:peptide methionine sulfoxide reductase msrA/msrB
MTESKAYYAGGCFWGVEHLFQSKAGVINAVSGYMGGAKDNPTYQEVLTGRTGHLEAVEITYDPVQISYEDLTKFFFEIHDPTQANGQGPDIGPQYLSAVFYSSDTEKKITEDLIGVLMEKGYDVVTKLLPAKKFWVAEEYHQDYYVKKNQQPYCHFYQKRF